MKLSIIASLLLAAPIEISMVMAYAIPQLRGDPIDEPFTIGPMPLRIVSEWRQPLGYLAPLPTNDDEIYLTIDENLQSKLEHADFSLDSSGRFNYIRGEQVFVASFDPPPLSLKHGADRVTPVVFSRNTKNLLKDKFWLWKTGEKDQTRQRVEVLQMNGLMQWWACKYNDNWIIHAPLQNPGLYMSFQLKKKGCMKIHITTAI